MSAIALGGLGATAEGATFSGRNGPIAFTVTRDTRTGALNDDCATVQCDDSRTYLLDVGTRRVREAAPCSTQPECHDTGPVFDRTGMRLLLRRQTVVGPGTLSRPSLAVAPAFRPGVATTFLPAALDYEWAPRSERVVVASSPSSLVPTDLYIVDITSDKRTRITRGRAYSPDWSRTGLIAFDRPTGKGRAQRDRSDIFTIRPGDSHAHRLTRDGRSGAARWSPSGKYLAFVRSSPNAEKGRLYVMTATGRRKRFVAETTGTSVWSPDGRWFAYVEGRSIYRIRRNGSHRQRLYTLRKRQPGDFLGLPSWGRRSEQ